jgi:cell division protein FtsW (lipid II flippase)
MLHSCTFSLLADLKTWTKFLPHGSCNPPIGTKNMILVTAFFLLLFLNSESRRVGPDGKTLEKQNIASIICVILYLFLNLFVIVNADIDSWVSWVSWFIFILLLLVVVCCCCCLLLFVFVC